MRIEMRINVTLPRRGGGTVTYSAGRQYNASDDEAAMLGGAAFDVDAQPAPAPSPTEEINEPEPPPSLDDGYEEE